MTDRWLRSWEPLDDVAEILDASELTQRFEAARHRCVEAARGRLATTLPFDIELLSADDSSRVAASLTDVEPRPQPNSARPARPFGLGPLRVEISSAPLDVVDRLDRLFATMPAPPDEPAETITIAVRATEDGYETHIDGERRTRSAHLWQHDAGIAARLNRLALDNEPELLHLHAGVVARGGKGVVLLGPSGSGKSTFTAHLVRSGWVYLTDEMVALETDPVRLRPYPRPLTLKQGSWALFPEVPDFAAVSAEGAVPPRIEVPVSAFGATVATEPVTPALLVSVRFVEGEPSVAPLTPTEVLSDLVGDSLDLGRAGIDGMQTLVALAATVPGVRLATGDLDRSEELLVQSLDAAVVGPARLRHIPPDPQRSPTAHAWEFDDTGTGVVYDIESGVMVSVDASGLAVWEAMATSTSIDDIAAQVGAPVDAMESIAEFVSVLGEHGLVAR